MRIYTIHISTLQNRAFFPNLALAGVFTLRVLSLASINEVNLHRARLVLRWATVSGFNFRCRTFILACTCNYNQSPKANSGSIPLGSVNEYQLRLGRQGGMIHSVSGCTRGVQVKLWNPLRTHAIPERFGGVFTTRRYINPRLPYLTLPYLKIVCWIQTELSTSGGFSCQLLYGSMIT